jgi:hypothetical protein
MPTRRVLVHDCEPQIDEGRKFACSCTRLITSRDALALVGQGRARWKLQLKIGGVLVEIHDQVILPARRHRLNARLINDHDVDLAYVQDRKYSRDRIEAVGESQAQALVDLGASGTKEGDTCKPTSENL